MLWRVSGIFSGSWLCNWAASETHILHKGYLKTDDVLHEPRSFLCVFILRQIIYDWSSQQKLEP